MTEAQRIGLVKGRRYWGADMKRDDWLHEKITLVSDLALTIQILKKAHEDAQLMVSRLDGTIKVAEQNLERVKAAFEDERKSG